MNRLRTRFGLVLSIALLVATFLPILIFYLLGVTGLVEVTYVAEVGGRQEGAPGGASPADQREIVNLPPLPLINESLGEERRLAIPRINPDTGERMPDLSFDPGSGLWRAAIPSNQQRVIFTSPVFRFRIELPAWLALGSLPLIGLFFGLFLSVVLSRSVTRPVTQLAEAAKAIGRRDLGYRVETGGSQELQDLAQSFNRMAEELEHAEVARRNLMADIAHELRTPLTVLDGNLRAILDGVHTLNEEEIALLYEQTRHLNRLVDDLRELSLAESEQLSLDRKEVDLARLVKETVAHFDLIAQERGVEILTRLDEPLMHPSLDEHRIRQVLHNLLANAFRFTPRGGKVEVSAKRSSEDDSVEITVTDSGAGISPEELPYIFDRFYRVEETSHLQRDGSGLGLAIVKAIVEAQGGSIRATSDGKDHGCTFSIRFPG